MNQHKIVSAALCAGVLSMTASAQAQQFADRGTFIIAAERLFGFYHTNYEIDPEGPGTQGNVKTNNIGLLGQGQHEHIPQFYTVPRVAFDYFVIDGLSIGGSLVFWHSSSENDDTGGEADYTAFAIAPRVGYAFMFADRAGIWPRGGLSVFTGGLDVGPGNFSVTGLGFDIEAPFVFTPADHVAILAGPSFDVAIVAGGEIDGNAGPFGASIDHDTSLLHFGLYAGLGTWF